MLQVRLGLTTIPRPAQAKGPQTLRDRPLDSCTTSVELLPLLARMARSRLLQRLILRTRLELEMTCLLFGPRAQYEALKEARARHASEEGQQLYARRAGIEGTISQGVRAFGLRRTRYRGQAKTHVIGIDNR